MFKRKNLGGAQKLLGAALALIIATTALAACGGSSTNSNQTTTGDIHKIKHVIVIMQENRSFDSYFGTYPGADGIPMHIGVTQS